MYSSRESCATHTHTLGLEHEAWTRVSWPALGCSAGCVSLAIASPFPPDLRQEEETEVRVGGIPTYRLRNGTTGELVV